MRVLWYGERATQSREISETLRHQVDFSGHDIVFEFRGSRGEEYNLRCSAKDFLTSPWIEEIPVPHSDLSAASHSSAQDDDSEESESLEGDRAPALMCHSGHSGSSPRCDALTALVLPR